MSFGEKLVVLHTTPSMFNKFACLEVEWRFEQRTFYISSSWAKPIVACQKGLKMNLALDELKEIDLCSNFKH